MQLGAPAGGPGPVPDHVAAAVSAAAARLGHRPAVTDLLPGGRHEQSAASLAQWAAKGAHFLDIELGLVGGSWISLDAPPSWTTAAVALGAWWAGIGLSVDERLRAGRTPADIAIVHESRAPGASTGAAETFWLGDAIDGAPRSAVPGGGEAWTHAVQPFPDQPPPPRGTSETPAVDDGARTVPQRMLIELATSRGGEAPLGLEVTERSARPDRILELALLCLRPLWCGHPTVVVRDVPREAARGERVGQWY